ncbi:histone-lysine N-methyltransferase ASHH3 [Cucumis melo var. makuwa]|uniref:Histone-lysine N-methyltransferase ASHH3 n=1 Tax=Cucumis melo var. makuwa TaxID=1194695 RepID=A0A5D3B9N6_CUCMM|nr:histone-lysine N-methyltransferase ASHH3 [Cucumis melo var. makuwa]TYJ95586.1 histone-lysine N-methyltransferase ASHH3 [Cucumis melo var. makuwa]
MLTALSLPQSWTIDSVVRPVHLPQRRLLFFPLTLCIPHGVSLIQSFDFQLRKSNSKRASGLANLQCENSGIGNVFHKLMRQIGNPVDFELPDWFSKWKPMPYTFIRRNVYLTKKFKRRVEDDGIFCSCSPSPGSPGVCCDKDCHCGMLLSSCSSGCKCGVSCLNKPFQHRPVKKMKLVKTEKCGSGIVADEDIKQGEFVIEYVGEVIDDKTCEERLWNMKHRGETNFYLCEINRDMVIDATYKGNKSRYINHSCCPNTEMQKWIIDGETRIGIFATRDIPKGEHLTYDYQFVQFGADQDCHCGAVDCRRKLGVRPTKPKTSSDAALKLVASQVAVSSPKLKAYLSRRDVRFLLSLDLLLLLGKYLELSERECEEEEKGE